MCKHSICNWVNPQYQIARFSTKGKPRFVITSEYLIFILVALVSTNARQALVLRSGAGPPKTLEQYVQMQILTCSLVYKSVATNCLLACRLGQTITQDHINVRNCAKCAQSEFQLFSKTALGIHKLKLINQ